MDPNISPHYISITFAPLHYKCGYICHNLSGFTVWSSFSCMNNIIWGIMKPWIISEMGPWCQVMRWQQQDIGKATFKMVLMYTCVGSLKSPYQVVDTINGNLGLYSLKRHHLTGRGIPIINIKRSDDRLRYIDGLVQERRNSIANALSCTNPSIYWESLYQ